MNWAQLFARPNRVPDNLQSCSIPAFPVAYLAGKKPQEERGRKSARTSKMAAHCQILLLRKFCAVQFPLFSRNLPRVERKLNLYIGFFFLLMQFDKHDGVLFTQKTRYHPENQVNMRMKHRHGEVSIGFISFQPKLSNLYSTIDFSFPS